MGTVIAAALARLGGMWAKSPDKLYGEALAKAKAGCLAEAIVLIQRRITGDDGTGRRDLVLGDLYFVSGDPRQAARFYLAAIEATSGVRVAYRKYLIACRAAEEPDKAEEELRRLCKSRPSDPDPRNYLGVVLYLAGRLEEAQQLWWGIISSSPKYSPAHSNLGQLYQHQGKLDQALVEYKLAIELDPNGSMGAYNNIAELYIGQGEFESAIEYLLEATGLDPSSAVPWANLGHCYGAQGRTGEAVKAYERSLGCEPGITTNDTQVDVLTNLAKLYLEQHDYERAQRVCQRALGRAPMNSDALATLGQAYFQQSKYGRAVEAFRQALSLNPMSLRNLLVHRHLALAYFKMGHFDKATAEYKRANSWHPDHIFISTASFLAADGRRAAEDIVARCRADLLARPNDVDLRIKAGDAYLQLGCLEEAVEEYSIAKRMAPSDLELLCKLGMAYYANDQRLLAVVCFQRAVGLNPGYAPAHVGLGLAYLLRGSVDTAILKFEWAVTISPKLAEAHNFLGNAYRQKGDLQSAVRAYRRAIQVYPNYAQAHNNLGLAYLLLDKVDEAIVSFRQALEVFPDYVPALCNLGRAHLALGDTESAKASLQAALAVNPSNPQAQELLQQEFSDAREGIA